MTYSERFFSFFFFFHHTNAALFPATTFRPCCIRFDATAQRFSGTAFGSRVTTPRPSLPYCRHFFGGFFTTCFSIRRPVPPCPFVPSFYCACDKLCRALTTCRLSCFRVLPFMAFFPFPESPQSDFFELPHREAPPPAQAFILPA